MRFVFDDIVVDCEQVKLTKHAKHIECEPRIFELLVYFCKHPQEAISREELLMHVWGGRTVSNAAINRAVGELRKLLEDNPSSPQLIKTVSKVGYRLALIPTLFESQYQERQKQGSTNQSEFNHTLGSQTEATNFKAKQIKKSAAELHSLPPHILKGKWFWLVFVCALLIFVVKTSITSQKDIKKLDVLGRQPVTSLIGSAFNPSYDLKSNTLFFLYRTDADANAQLFMKKANGSVQALSHDDYYYTDVLYGANGFIYASRLNNLQQRYCEIVKVELVTKRISSIMDCGKGVVTQLAFDARKMRLIYQYRTIISEPYAIYSYQLDTGRKQQLTHPAQVGNNTGDYVFAISTDSKTLAIVEYNSDKVDKIKLVDLKDNRIIATAPFIDDVYGLIWRSEHQVLASNSDGLFEFNIDDFSLTPKEHSDQFGRLALGSDKHSILTERSQMTVNLFSYSKHPITLKPLTASSGISRSPILGNRSNILAFKSDRSGEKEIYIQVEGQDAFIAEFEDHIAYVGSMAWSSTDDKLVASINNVLYLYSLESQKWQRLAEHFTQVHHVAFVKESIMFSAEVNDQWNIWELSLDNGQIEQVTTKGGYSVQGNGSKIYITKFNYDGLYQLDLKTGLESTLIGGYPIAGWRHWQLRNNKIYYLLDKEYKEFDLIRLNERVLHNFLGRIPNSCNMSYQYDFFACEKVESNTSNIWQFQLPL
jgi:DNA-binding winged helix-turn-helix (wHTH) protein/Tol biopolymer transport system component